MDESTVASPTDTAAVPGTAEAASVETGEHLGVAQPLAPNPVPSTAAPSQDAVTVNTHLRKVAQDLTAVAEYVRSFLVDNASVASDIEAIANTVRNLVR